ncbi:hypothetical protein CSC3H3_07490 [Thalassospira marina]|uniref:Uncharacterized protein n=1 Tax=Thalassospira marina TaxID=2048283 RepID=A0ABM6Q7R6_9PROT|nr:hypothetical protein CSC3H3_07490 [Thalassospira marina]
MESLNKKTDAPTGVRFFVRQLAQPIIRTKFEGIEPSTRTIILRPSPIRSEPCQQGLPAISERINIPVANRT